METLYRKVTFEINDKNHNETWLIGKSANFIFNPNTRNGEEFSDFLAGCEEIPDNSNQIEKLEAEKAELIENHFKLFRRLNSLVNRYQLGGFEDILEKSREINRKHSEGGLNMVQSNP